MLYLLLLKYMTYIYINFTDSILSTAFHSQHMLEAAWIDSFKLCPNTLMLARYSLVYTHAKFSRRGTYWLSNTRRWIQGTCK